MHRRSLVVILALLMGLQSATATVAVALGESVWGSAAAARTHHGTAAMSTAAQHWGCCRHAFSHSATGLCLVHCAAVMALPPHASVLPTVSSNCDLIVVHAHLSLGERTSPELRPPIVFWPVTLN